MRHSLKRVSEQVIVITGATSGIGLATAELAASKGAKLLLAARSEQTLADIAHTLSQDSCEAIAVPADVGIRSDLERVAAAAIERFGRIDTWINDAAAAIYGRLDEVSEEDSRKLFDTNFWGVVNGSLAALPHLKRQGGVLINVGSEVSEAVAPLLGMYSASKHAVKGFTDALRVELEYVDNAPVHITLIEPTAVNTPFPQHGRNYMDREPKLPDPTIDPGQVADAILHAAEHPVRYKKVGGKAVLNTMVSKWFPGLADRMTAKNVSKQQYDEKPRQPEGNLFRSSEEVHQAGRVHGTGGRKED